MKFNKLVLASTNTKQIQLHYLFPLNAFTDCYRIWCLLLFVRSRNTAKHNKTGPLKLSECVTYSGRGQSSEGHSNECLACWAKHGASIHRRCSVLREETWLRVQVRPSVEELQLCHWSKLPETEHGPQSQSRCCHAVVMSLCWTCATLARSTGSA